MTVTITQTHLYVYIYIYIALFNSPNSVATHNEGVLLSGFPLLCFFWDWVRAHFWGVNWRPPLAARTQAKKV